MALDDKSWVKLLISYLFLVLLISCAARPVGPRMPAQADLLDVVFDLDWTLIGEVKSTTDIPATEILIHEQDRYRLLPGARELIRSLLAEGRVRISFFSGGPRERNEAVLKQVMVDGVSLYDLAYKVLSRTDLTDRSAEVESDARFSERYKKDLRLVNTDLTKVIMIDDNDLFAVDENQRRNFIWLGETFENLEQYSHGATLTMAPKYRPKNYSAWLGSRLKLPVVDLILKDVLKNSDEGWNIERMQGLVLRSGLQNGSWSLFKSKAIEVLPQLAPRSCTQGLELLLRAN